KSGMTVTETVLPATAGSTSYRVYTENSPTVQTAIIIANPSADPVTVTVEATTLSGASANLTGLLTIPGNGQILTLEGQFPGFEKIEASFEGVLRISTGTASSVAAGVFRVRVNERGDLVVSTFPPVDETATTLRTALAFPQFVTGGGFTTQVVLFSGRANTASWGVMRLLDQSGKPIPMQRLLTRVGSQQALSKRPLLLDPLRLARETGALLHRPPLLGAKLGAALGPD